MMQFTFVWCFFILLLHLIWAQDELCDDPMPPDLCPFHKDLPLKNVALNALASQSTKYKSGGEAKLAVDGKLDQKFWGGLSCSHTAEHVVSGETVPWFQIDFGRPHLIHNLSLYTRNDRCCAKRYHDMQVRVGNHMERGLGRVFYKNGLCAEVVGGGYKQGHIFNLTCAPCLAGRYLSIQIVRNCTNCNIPLQHNILSLCEVKAFGYPV